jgi:hypothetical protein
MRTLWVDIAGWIGSFLILYAYFGNSTGRLKSTGTSYQFLNVAASILLIINTVYYGAYPSSFVNVVWAGIGLTVLIRKPKKESQ